MDRPCDYNPEVICDREKCHGCGWHPEVAKARQESVRRSLVADQKLYRIPFSGYCEVWANSPEEAADKAETVEQQFFAHYDYGEPICSEDAESPVHRGKPVLQLTKEGEVIKEWSSGEEAAKELNIHPSAISHCCAGRRNTAGGYKWRYAYV